MSERGLGIGPSQPPSEQIALLSSILDSSTEYSIIANDLVGNILTWNEGARRNYGYSAEEMVGGQNSRILHTPDDIDSGQAQALLDTALLSGKAEGVFGRVRKGGARFTASVAVTLRRSAAGEPIGFLLISKDITERQRLEEQVRRKNDELEEQYRRVQETSRLKSEFLANMSHELRTPLNAIIGFTELMHDGKVGPVGAEQKEFMGDILTSSRHLLQLINDVLDLSKVESGKMEFDPEPLEIAKVVGEVRDVLRSLAGSKKIAITVEISPDVGEVVADPGKLKQVLYNYLSNALKFTPDGGRVTVRVDPEGPANFRIEVEDSGIGIREEDLGRLFVEFQQLDASAAKKYQGTGLGLALTKRIVEAQDGQVGVRSRFGRGSVFLAVLPRVGRNLESPAPSTAADSARRREGGPRVLIIEDNADDRMLIVRAMARAGYSAQGAATGRESLAILEREQFDAITLDLILPDVSGQMVLRSLREAHLNRDTPVIVVTGSEKKGLVAGFQVQEILRKPIAEEDLLMALRRAVAKPDGNRPILVIDDDAQALKLADATLRGSGYRPLCLKDGNEALKAAADEAPAAVLLDLGMPGIDGFEFLMRFRRHRRNRRTPVIVWTARELTQEERLRLMSLAQGVVLKNDGTEALLDQLRLYVEAAPQAAEGAERGR